MGTRIANKQKQEWAQLLYTRERLTQKEIAEKVGVTEKTVGKWKTEGEWDSLRNSYSVTREQELLNIYTQMTELNEAIASRKKGERYATAREADTLVKLATAAKQLETDASLTEIINTFSGFIEWLRPIDLPKAKELIMIQDSYIKHKLTGR